MRYVLADYFENCLENSGISELDVLEAKRILRRAESGDVYCLRKSYLCRDLERGFLMYYDRRLNRNGSEMVGEREVF